MTSGSTILVADDDSSVRMVLEQALSRAGYDVRTTSNAATLWKWVSDGEGDLVITDVVMPDENGLDLIPRMLKIRPALRVIVMSAQTTILTAVKASERGAFEYLPKPFDINELLSVVHRGLVASKSPTQGDGPDDGEEEMPLIGRSAAMQDIYRGIARLMQTDLSVIITGESGTGKELVARALHDFGRRRNKPFVAINMAAIPRDLIESELFGHEKGAFTGALTARQGRFGIAGGGTLFLDEIGDISPSLQAKLLRLLQEKEYLPVGATRVQHADVRFVAATNRDLEAAVASGAFREDLYYRLNVITLNVPPLRERSDDIKPLAEFFATRYTSVAGQEISPPVMALLQAYPWPGNVRELENVIERATVLGKENEITLGCLPPNLVTGMSSSVTPLTDVPDSGMDLDAYLGEIEKEILIKALAKTDGVRKGAAGLLGITFRSIRYRLSKYGLGDDNGDE